MVRNTTNATGSRTPGPSIGQGRPDAHRAAGFRGIGPRQSRKSTRPAPFRGRGAGYNPPNRFDQRSEVDLAGVADELDGRLELTVTGADGRQVTTRVYPDHSRSLINPVDSPDLGFSWTINPYRGCEHGCIYCYARPYHEMLSFSAGLDFETKLLAKFDAAQVLESELAQPKWAGEAIAMGGATDCYQPVEARLLITRGCLEVLAECRQAVRLTTKSRLILRDLDVLQELAKHRTVQVAVSLTTLENDLAARMEPRASSPGDRLWTIRRLASAGIPVTGMIAPVIPGLTDHELPALLAAAAEAGATSASYELLRLPHAVAELFDDWLKNHYPDRRQKVLSGIRQMRGDKLNDSRWHVRMTGMGPMADHLRQTFRTFARRYGLACDDVYQWADQLNTDAFRRPRDSAQLELFA